MAFNIKGLCNLSIRFANNIFPKTSFLNVGVRFLYSDKVLGVTAYENTRYIFRNQFISIEDTFRNKMLEVCNKDDGVIFTEDLKAMLHLAQKSDEDLSLAIRMMEKYLVVNKDLKFGSYTFGPVVMRLFYYLNVPDVALTTFNNPIFEEFFNQRSTVQILMTLLYKHSMYYEMRNIADRLFKKDDGKNKFRSSVVVLFAGSYKENTVESYNYALETWRNFRNTGLEVSLRSTALLAALAINQKFPEVALELVGMIKRQQYIDVKCLKILALLGLKKYVQIVPVLKFPGEENVTYNQHRHTYYADVIMKIEEYLNQEPEPLQELQKIIGQLRSNDRITHHMTLEESLLRPINLLLPRTEKFEQSEKRHKEFAPHHTGLRNVL